jgi:putative ABC transport system substrate-binding protein
MLRRQLTRRQLLPALAGAVAWPIAGHAEQGERMRRIGVITGITIDDPETKLRLAAFLQEMRRLGWTEGRNIRLDYRSSAGNSDEMRKHAAELAALAPDVILAIGNATVAPLMQATRTVPIVFTIVVDPVGAAFIKSLARPGGNVTGFMMFEYSLSGKWLELLKQIVPGIQRTAVLRDPTFGFGIGQFAVIQAVAPSMGIDVSAINMHDVVGIEREIANFAVAANGGLILTSGPLSVVHRDLIVTLANRYKLPAVYYERFFAAGGGLISYGPNFVDANRQAAGYVDRILKGEKPADLPVQAPTKYELVINLKTAKALGLDVPAQLLARADEVIE